ncbi:MFS transporter [Cryptosporangium phraense]|uniref:MFS transporter n=1 Tax=Cryptosporangium phraense TaxID=2593070 RepID=A0A545AIN0_9ACTN|nr:MFS transporter [Cryptosporangium phraense]TQS41187.1 MFS transporter [Cryptosporangium phraense]
MLRTRPTTEFTGYLAAWTSSALGDGLRATALPLLASSLAAGPRGVAVVAAAGGAPWLVFGLVSGVFVDRWPRLRMMVAVQLTRAAALGALAALVAADLVGIPVLVVVAFVLGTCEVVFDVAAHSALPSIVPREQLQKANSRLLLGEISMAELAGPLIGGVLFAVAAVLAVAVNAAAFLVAFGLLALTVGSAGRPEPREPGSIGQDLRDGARWFFRARTVRAISVLSVAVNLASGGFLAILVVLARERLGVGAVGYGVLVAVGSVGGLIAGAVGDRLAGAGQRRAICLAAGPVIAAAFLAVGVFPTWPVTALALAVWGAAATLFNIVALSFRQAAVPDEMLGRVTAVHRFLVWGALPLGALAAGFLADAAGVTAVAPAAAAVVAVGVLAVWRPLSQAPRDQFAL